jgi:hypothetical protein
MNTRTKAILTTAFIALGASALGVQAADNRSSIENQLESDGSPESEPAQTAVPKEHETPRQAALNAWFVQERAQPTVLVPYVPPKADSTVAAEPPTPPANEGD